MSESLLEYEIRDDVAVLCLNDPMTLNACSDEMWALLIKKLTQAQRAARAIVLTGVGWGCSPGANPSNSAAGKPATERDAGERPERLFNPVVALRREFEPSFVNAVNGPALSSPSPRAPIFSRDFLASVSFPMRVRPLC
jgi:2-(1,2-epoxy-1,2-dihydrophenyl)acetyl-CoA isomerase